jgi:hypothetical protein
MRLCYWAGCLATLWQSRYICMCPVLYTSICYQELLIIVLKSCMMLCTRAPDARGHVPASASLLLGGCTKLCWPPLSTALLTGVLHRNEDIIVYIYTMASMGTAFRRPQLPHQPTCVCYWAGRLHRCARVDLHASALPSTAANNFVNVIPHVLSR